MPFKVVMLGTASAFPTKERAHTSIYLDVGKEAFLFDAGESVQRQILFAGLSPMKISKIFISHWHGDHVLGLGGLLQSYGINKRSTKLEIYGPAGIRKKINNLFQTFDLRIEYPIEVKDVKNKKVLETEEYKIVAEKCAHGAIPCLAYAFIEAAKRKINTEYLSKFGLRNHPIIKNLQEGKDIFWGNKKITAKKATYLVPGKKIVFILDSAFTKKLVSFASGADLLICEATFGEELRAEAKKFGHMCAKDAAELAKRAKVKKLILTHFSQRYKDTNTLLMEAKKVFEETKCAKDFDVFVV
ncbi:MAG: ribonuclease Z [Candidatus Nanoarchaeia archaeon]